MSIFAFHEIYVQVQPNQIMSRDLNTGRTHVEKIDPMNDTGGSNFKKIQDCLVKTIRAGSSFSLLKKRVILHWQIDAPVEAKTIGPIVFRDCEAKDFLLCTDKNGSLEEILKLAPWRLKK